jgi:dUTP pyrophosphatase
MIVRFRRLPGNDDLPLPTRQTSGSAGFDIASAEDDFVLQPGERRVCSTGLEMELPYDVEAQIRPRSGLALRHGVTLPNAPATIDPDYRGELKVILWNAGPDPVPIARGSRIAQMVFSRFLVPDIVESAELNVTARGRAGFGSTGR